MHALVFFSSVIPSDVGSRLGEWGCVRLEDLRGGDWPWAKVGNDKHGEAWVYIVDCRWWENRTGEPRRMTWCVYADEAKGLRVGDDSLSVRRRRRRRCRGERSREMCGGWMKIYSGTRDLRSGITSHCTSDRITRPFSFFAYLFKKKRHSSVDFEHWGSQCSAWEFGCCLCSL